MRFLQFGCIFATNTPDPPRWTLNLCFGAFHTIWVHLRLLSCLMELGAKRSELVQKFVPRSCVGVFRDERTRFTPLEPKLMFWCISYHLGPLGFLTKLGAKRSELVQMFMARSRTGILLTNAPDPPHWTLNSCFVAFCTIWVHLGPLSCLTKLVQNVQN